MEKALRKGLGWILGGLLLLGCSSQAEPTGADESLAQGGQNEPGDGGDTANGLTRCAVRPLSDACEQRTCPASPEEVKVSCVPSGAGRYETECGGTVVIAPRGQSSTNWYFDATGTLIGMSTIDDVPAACGDGTEGFVHVFGETCLLRGDRTELCPLSD